MNERVCVSVDVVIVVRVSVEEAFVQDQFKYKTNKNTEKCTTYQPFIFII